MNKFPIKFSRFLAFLLILTFVASMVSGFWNTVNFFSATEKQFIQYLQFFLAILTSIFTFAFTIAVLFNSKIVIDDKSYTVVFGIVVKRISQNEIVKLIITQKTQRIYLSLKNEKITLVMINYAQHEQFVFALSKANKNLTVEYTDG